MTKKFSYYVILFGLGAFGYGLIEILWRSHTHPTMFLAGGISFVVLAIIETRLKKLKFFYRVLAGGLFITFIELVFGLIFNIWLNQAVWNYSSLQFNLFGQVSLLYTVFWCFLSVPMLILTEFIKSKVFGQNQHISTNYSPESASNTP